MPQILSRYATPLITGLFLVSLVSGVALFFHIGSAAFHGMHEWLSMVLILPFVLHLWKNWRSFLTYFKRVPMAAALAVSVVAGIAFAYPAMTADSNVSPRRAVFQAFENGSIAHVAPLFGHDAESLSAVLKEKGYKLDSADISVRKLARASGKSPMAVIAEIASARK